MKKSSKDDAAKVKSTYKPYLRSEQAYINKQAIQLRYIRARREKERGLEPGTLAREAAEVRERMRAKGWRVYDEPRYVPMKRGRVAST